MTIRAENEITLVRVDDGTAGADGHSPVVTATRSGDTVTIKVDDATIASVKDGTDGAAGTPGAAGADGKTSYLHIAYATNATGTAGFSTTDPVGKTYIGQYTDFVQADSTDPSKYSWTLIKGDTGATGPSGTVISDTAPTDTGQLWLDTSGETDTLKYHDGNSWVETPVESTAKSAYSLAAEADQKTTKNYYAYADNRLGSGFSVTNTNKQYMGIAASTDSTQPTDVTLYTWILNPVFASKVATEFLSEISGGAKITSPEITDDTYAALTSFALAFYLGGSERARFGYSEDVEAYGMEALNAMLTGSGAAVKFDNTSDSAARGRFCWEIRDNGHLSLKLF